MKQLFKLSIILLILAQSLIARHGYYSGEASAILDKATNILINNGYCENINDCRTKEYGFTSGNEKGVYAHFFQINRPETINQIISLYTSTYFKHNQRIDIELKFNEHSHKENRWYKTSFIKLEFKKKSE